MNKAQNARRHPVRGLRWSSRPTCVRAGTLRCILLLATVVSMPAGAVSAANQVSAPGGSSAKLLSGGAFEAALERQLSLAWEGEALRDGLRQLSTTRQVAILTDRRINPGLPVALQVKGVSLRELLKLIATETGTEVSFLENAVYLGPPATARRLRTTVERASATIVSSPGNGIETGRAEKSPAAAIPVRRSFELLRRRALEWDDLTSPIELLDRISEIYGLTIEGRESVPHDLWAGGSLPASNAPEMLLIVLAQFDLSFDWQENGAAVRIVPLPENPQLVRTFTVRQGTAAAFAEQLAAALPGATAQAKGRTLHVTGTYEQLEAVDAMLHPDRQGRSVRPNPATETTFTFEVRNAPLKAFLETLEKQAGFQFDYDESELTDAGVRLDGFVNLKMQEASAAELFEAMFHPAGIEFTVDGQRVRLKPAPKPAPKPQD